MLKHVLFLLAKTLGIGAAIGAVLSLGGYLLGWRNASQFSNALTLVGVILMGLGVFSSNGGSTRGGDVTTLYVETAGSQNLHQRSQRWINDMTQNSSAAVNFILIGLFVLLAAFLIEKLG